MDASLPPLAAEPCPTPQSWQDVVRSFREEARGIELDTPAAVVRIDELGSGPTLAFLPGWGGSSLLATLTAWLLKEEFRCVLVEHPVWKSRPAISDLLRETAEVYGLVLEHAAPAGTALYAPAWGGMVALPLLAAQPQLIDRAIVQSSGLQRRWTWTERTALRLGTSCPGQVRRVPGWSLAQLENHRRWFPPFDESRCHFLLDQLGRTRTSELCRRLLAASKAELEPIAAQVEQPVCLLRCEGDGRAVMEASQRLERALPRARVEEMALSGHFPYLTHPHRLVKVIRTFMSSS